MYHLLKGFHEYLTRYAQTQYAHTFLDTPKCQPLYLTGRTSFPSLSSASMAWARQYVRRTLTLTHNRHCNPDCLTLLASSSSHRLSSRRSRQYIMTRRAYHQTKSSQRWARTVRIPHPFPPLVISYTSTSCLYPLLHTAGKVALPSAVLQFWDLGGQRGIRSIWPKYYDDCHAVVYVVDAVDHERLSEGWEVFGTYGFFSIPFLNAKKQGALKRKRKRKRGL
jgi:hypothetical protein